MSFSGLGERIERLRVAPRVEKKKEICNKNLFSLVLGDENI